MIRFVHVGAPVTTNQGYRSVMRGGRSRMLLSPLGEFYKASLAAHARRAHARAGRPPAIEQGAAVGIRFVFPTLATDIDGAAKFVLDAIANGSKRHPGAGLVLNDNRVRRLVIDKGDCDGRPRTEVVVAQVGEAACPTCGCSCRALLGGEP